jgi:hypothetical protein
MLNEERYLVLAFFLKLFLDIHFNKISSVIAYRLSEVNLKND